MWLSDNVMEAMKVPSGEWFVRRTSVKPTKYWWFDAQYLFRFWQTDGAPGYDIADTTRAHPLASFVTSYFSDHYSTVI